MTTVRLDKDMKDKFDALCKGFGMSVNTAFNLFVNKVVDEERIPFTIGKSPSSSRNDLSILDNLSGAWNDIQE